jgi:hypothetical protein
MQAIYDIGTNLHRTVRDDKAYCRLPRDPVLVCPLLEGLETVLGDARPYVPHRVNEVLQNTTNQYASTAYPITGAAGNASNIPSR